MNNGAVLEADSDGPQLSPHIGHNVPLKEGLISQVRHLESDFRLEYPVLDSILVVLSVYSKVSHNSSCVICGTFSDLVKSFIADNHDALGTSVLQTIALSLLTRVEGQLGCDSLWGYCTSDD